MGYEEVLDFWLGPLDAEGLASDEASRRWFTKDEGFDRALRERFGAVHEATLRGEHEDWRRSPRGLAGYVIVLDQLSRNMFRGTPRMFAADGRALEAAREGIERGDDRRLPHVLRAFLYMPLMHAEELPAQERCVELFRALAEEASGRAKENAETSLRFAVQHRDIVARFGRFPHRNAVLGRESTEEERAFLEQPGSSF